MRFRLRPMLGVFTFAAVSIGILSLAFTGDAARLLGMLGVVILISSIVTGIAAWKLRR
jgi:hypothetical protein